MSPHPIDTSCSVPVPNDHNFMPPAANASRSPCPALNVLANHGYINRSGRDISFFELVGALRLVYNLTLPLAFFLTMGGIILGGHQGVLSRIDLHDLARHNAIEHDASLSRSNANSDDQFAPVEVDEYVVARLVSPTTTHGGFSLRDLAKARMDREVSLHADLDAVHRVVAAGEASMTWLLMKDSHGLVPSKVIKQWYGEERLPDEYHPPASPIGLKKTHANANRVTSWISHLQHKST
ncbi:Cloroperoxidase [Pluteus cervinus]|uniref:Cloroperoxidase n=1 Tax=Pluteus cervinus TaxID=181527 RepID=A0ACD3ATS7_9AGAR|nr:Cloroperoxidase [Pluteus cervinus]